MHFFFFKFFFFVAGMRPCCPHKWNRSDCSIGSVILRLEGGWGDNLMTKVQVKVSSFATQQGIGSGIFLVVWAQITPLEEQTLNPQLSVTDKFNVKILLKYLVISVSLN